ncbi:type II toxin-antitoxin system death-on-curing family toxin [Aerococcus viridans]|uniref:type II toxin-antitoxin system death-on-curing family toxin n=1 Tax=Aerococcus viridans TaxID=1377 RepID=UPI003B2252C8
MIRYLTERELVMINTLQIQRYSPEEQIGVKEPTALNMCVALPKQAVFDKELYPTLFDKAAKLYQKLVQKHCFHNANKRTALVAVHTFLRLNGVTLNVSNKEIEDYTVAIATDEDLTWEAISSWLEVHSK